MRILCFVLLFQSLVASENQFTSKLKWALAGGVSVSACFALYQHVKNVKIEQKKEVRILDPHCALCQVVNNGEYISEDRSNAVDITNPVLFEVGNESFMSAQVWRSDMKKKKRMCVFPANHRGSVPGDVISRAAHVISRGTWARNDGMNHVFMETTAREYDSLSIHHGKTDTSQQIQ